MGGGKGSTSYTVGYKYYVGMHQALCHGPVDALLRIRIDNKDAFLGKHTGGRLSINKPNLFGGESREGGISGDIDFEQGAPTQGQNDYLAAQLGSTFLPAFRGVCCAVLRRMYMGINPYLKQWEWRLQRIHTTQDGAVQWYDEKAEIPVYAEIIAPGQLEWKYKVVDVADTADYSAVSYDDSGWSLGYSPFADKPWETAGGPGDYNFPTMPATVVSQQKKVWLRTVLTLESNVDSFFFDSFVDNGIEVWVNGVKVISNYEQYGHYFSSYIPGSYFNVGDNQLTVLGRDDNLGDRPNNWFWFDLRLQDTAKAYSDMNPAHIIRECLTNSEWGMGYPADDIDDDAFMVAADRLAAESMGISILWDSSSDIESFLTDIIRHIDASIYVDRSTGKFVLKLIRGGYDDSSLLSLHESNVLRIENFTRQTMAELVNEVVVKYWDSKDGQTKTGTIQDIALVQAMGGIVSATVDYPGFTNASLAYRVAQRDLKALSTPRVSCVIYANRQAHQLNIGDVFRLVWPQYGIDSMVMRVQSISLGGPTNNEIRIDCTQDVFDLPDMQLMASTDTPWQSSNLPPKVIENRLVFEAPYFELVQQQGQDTVDGRLLELPEAGYIGVAAVRPNAVSIAARIYTDSGAGYAEHGSVDFCPSATLTAAIGYTDTEITIDGGIDLDLVEVGTWAQIDEELVVVDAITDTTATIRRGVLDTVPAPHAARARIFCWDVYCASDNVEYITGDAINVKLCTVTGSGQLALTDAPIDAVIMAERAIRPYPPGNLQINATSYPTGPIEGTIAISWAHRDRTQQTAGTLQDYTYGDIGPETGTTYTVRCYIDDVLNVEQTLIAGTSTTLVPTSGGACRLAVASVRDGHESWQAATHVFEYLPAFDLRAIESGAGRATEDGVIRRVEED